MDKLTFTLTEQDYNDLLIAIESANIEGSLSVVRKIVVRLTILRQKLEQQYEHSTGRRPEERSDVAPDSGGPSVEGGGGAVGE